MKNNISPKENQETNKQKSLYLRAFLSCNDNQSASKLFKVLLDQLSRKKFATFSLPVFMERTGLGKSTVQRGLAKLINKADALYKTKRPYMSCLYELPEWVRDEAVMQQLKSHYKMIFAFTFLLCPSKPLIAGGEHVLTFNVINLFKKQQQFETASVTAELAFRSRQPNVYRSLTASGMPIPAECHDENPQRSCIEFEALLLTKIVPKERDNKKGNEMLNLSKEQLNHITGTYSTTVIERATKKITSEMHQGKTFNAPFKIFLAICDRIVKESQRGTDSSSNGASSTNPTKASKAASFDWAQQRLDHVAKWHKRALEMGIDPKGVPLSTIQNMYNGYTRIEEPTAEFTASVRPERHELDMNRFVSIANSIRDKQSESDNFSPYTDQEAPFQDMSAYQEIFDIL